MNAQFHTPSFGDEVFDLSDCDMTTTNAGHGIATNSNYISQQQQAQTKRVRSMDHALDEYSGVTAAHDDGVYQNVTAAAAMVEPVAVAATTTTTQQFINNAGMTVANQNNNNNNTVQQPQTTTMAARKQMTPATGTSTTTTTAPATDPNEPAKPLSAYALFFHDTVSAIKPHNPNCSFHELARIVGTMWEALDATHKNVYNKKNEAARNEYIKQMRIYRQQQQQQPQDDAASHQLPAAKPAAFDSGNANNFAAPTTTAQQQQQFNATSAITQQQQQAYNNNSANNNAQTEQPLTTANSNSATAVSNDPSPQQIQMLTEAGAVQKCTRVSCNKRAIINPDWEDEYCSNECVVLHCRNVFNLWINSNLEARKQ